VAGGHGNVPLKSNFFDPNQRTQDRISVSIVELESGATMTEELRVIIFIALGLSGVVGVWLSALWVAGGLVLPLSADISSAESVMENISTVVLILLVAGVVVAAVACSGHRRWH
jgi:hypothetical protein